jgi:UDP-GlcNAc:undecaprenyl-phosphate/decaprenyl-phosphate GlcNAc-1-phosphate transferase
MFERGLVDIRLLLLIPIKLPDAITVLIGAVAAFLIAFLLTFFVKAFCYKMGWLDKPAARRVHKKAVPRLGGVAIYAAFVIASLLFYTPGSNLNAHANELTIYWLLIAAGALLVIVHAYDDIIGLGPWPKLIVQTVAVVIILGPWIDREFHGILLFTFNNPFGVDHFSPNLPWYREPTLFLVVHNSDIAFAAIPAILLTWFWTVGMMNTVNWIDGMDGLATGVVGITALFITLISFILHQYSIAVLAAIFTGAVFGFLPHNWNPAKIFMGDTGSMFLGLTLAVLSIMGGAKLALALMVLGVPILDVALVIINRIRRGQSPLHYDKTHLHHRLMAMGLSVKQICYLFYGVAIIFGLLALSFSGVHAAHFYKFVGLVLVVITMFGLIIWVDYRQRLHGVPIKLGGPDLSPEDNGEHFPKDSVPESAQEEQSETKAEANPPQSRSNDEQARTPLLH